MRMVWPILSIGLLFSSTGLAAHESTPQYNVVNLQAEAEQEVPNDELTVIMAAEHQGTDPAQLADQVNRDMQWATRLAKRQVQIEVTSLGYSTNPQYRDDRVVAWHARQELRLRSTAIAELSEMVGQLQERLQVKSMRFSPTHETSTRYENELIDVALQQFKQRAEIVSHHMPGADYRIVNLQINTGSSHAPMMMRAEMLSVRKMSVAAPAVEAGTSKLTVTVSGSVQYGQASQ